MIELKEGERGFRRPLSIQDDPLDGIVTIEGSRYSYEFLLALGQNEKNIGRVIRIEAKRDGVVVCCDFRLCPNCGYDLRTHKD